MIFCNVLSHARHGVFPSIRIGKISYFDSVKQLALDCIKQGEARLLGVNTTREIAHAKSCKKEIPAVRVRAIFCFLG